MREKRERERNILRYIERERVRKTLKQTERR